MDLDAALTHVHVRSAKTLLTLQTLQAQAQQVSGAIAERQAELLRLDGEERALLALKAQVPDGE